MGAPGCSVFFHLLNGWLDRVEQLSSQLISARFCIFDCASFGSECGIARLIKCGNAADCLQLPASVIKHSGRQISPEPEGKNVRRSREREESLGYE